MKTKTKNAPEHVNTFLPLPVLFSHWVASQFAFSQTYTNFEPINKKDQTRVAEKIKNDMKWFKLKLALISIGERFCHSVADFQRVQLDFLSNFSWWLTIWKSTVKSTSNMEEKWWYLEWSWKRQKVRNTRMFFDHWKLKISTDRVRLCQWLRKLAETRSDDPTGLHRRNEYMQFLRVMLQGNYHVLTKPFNNPPPDDLLVPLAECLANKCADAIPDTPRSGKLPGINWKCQNEKRFLSWQVKCSQLCVIGRRTIVLLCASSKLSTVCSVTWRLFPMPTLSRHRASAKPQPCLFRRIMNI